MRAFVGGEGSETFLRMGDGELTDLVRRELSEILNLSAEPDLKVLYRYPRGTPQYEVGHAARVNAVEALSGEGLWLTGASYRGVGIPDCIGDARRTARGVLQCAG